MFRHEFKLGCEVTLASLVFLLGGITFTFSRHIADEDLINGVDFLEEIVSRGCFI